MLNVVRLSQFAAASRWRIAILWVLLIVVVPMQAQGGATCPQIVEQALSESDRLCNSLARNQACYGSTMVDALPYLDVTDFTFATPGDIESIASIEEISVSPFDEALAQWGIALLKVQANLPDTLPGQNVNMVLFGDVTLSNGVPPVAETQGIIVEDNVDLLLAPNSTAPVVQTIAIGTLFTATGRDVSSTYVRARFTEDLSGWLLATNVDVGPIDALTIVDGTGPTDPRPMQVFTFTAGIGQPACDLVPSNGILMQSPDGAGEVEMVINDASVRMGSTLRLGFAENATGERFMTFSVYEGTQRIEFDGVAQFAEEGQAIFVPVGDDFLANGQPLDPVPLDPQADPIQLLDELIDIPDPLATDPNAPVITQVNVVPQGDAVLEDIFFTDANGDATTVNITATTSSDNVTTQIEGPSISIDPATQAAGAVLLRQTICEVDGPASVLYQVSISDASGLTSNTVEYAVNCP